MKHIALLVGVLLAATLVACGDDQDETSGTTLASATTTASAPPEPTSTGYPDTVTTNIPAVDAAIRAALAGDVATLITQMRYQSLACVALPSGPIPAPPKCLAGQAEGTVVQVFLSSGGEGAWRPSSEVEEVLKLWLNVSRHVYAVKQQPAPDGLTGAIYHIVFVTDAGRGNILRLSEAGIVAFSFDSGMNPRERAEQQPGTYVLPPK